MHFTHDECIQRMYDLDRLVRFEVASRIDAHYLPLMMNDWDDDVRCRVAFRIDECYLVQMMDDESASVRCRVAARIDRSNALLMSGIDRDYLVRKIALLNALAPRS
jgi:hypothetical protein